MGVETLPAGVRASDQVRVEAWGLQHDLDDAAIPL